MLETIFSPRDGDAGASIACVSELELEEDEKAKLNCITSRPTKKDSSVMPRLSAHNREKCLGCESYFSYCVSIY